MARSFKPVVRSSDLNFTEKERQRYHTLASFYNAGLRSKKDKELLVFENPLIAAELFYHFDDKELGNILVQQYATDRRDELRQISVYVGDVLKARKASERNLVNILGMHMYAEHEEEQVEEHYESLDLAEYVLGR